MVAFTSKITVGVDDSANVFDAVYLYGDGSMFGPCARECIQGLGRPRNVNNGIIKALIPDLPQVSSLFKSKDVDVLLDEWRKTQINVKEYFHRVKDGARYRLAPTLFAKVAAYIHLEKNESFGEAFITQCLKKGWTVDDKRDGNTDDLDDIDSNLSDAASDIADEEENAYNAIPQPISDSDFELIDLRIRTQTASHEDRLSSEIYIMSKTTGKTNIDYNTFQDIKKVGLSRLIPLSMIAHHTKEDGTLKPLAEKKWKELEAKKRDYNYWDMRLPKLFVVEKLQKVMKAFGTTLKDASTFQLSLTDTTNYRYMDEMRRDLEKCCTWHGRHKPKTLGTVLKTVLSRMGINFAKTKTLAH